MYDFMLDQSVASKRARDIVRACLPLQLDRAAIARRNDIRTNEMARLEQDDPQVLLDFADRMGIPVEANSRIANRTGTRNPTALAMTGLNSGMLADFGGSVLLRLAVSPSSDSCSDGAREMDNGTLVGSFLKRVG
ncbi:MAG: hypothetical protein ABJO29_06555 [Yoonia sp.]|uniref:hypothetical protein n=1 Tax=Yoonia sp. TaxID=2212373 RepID=UPI0032677089